MRGGTSREPYFNAADLPRERAQLAKTLLAVMGAGSPLQVDDIGGGQPATSKAAILSPSVDAWAQVAPIKMCCGFVRRCAFRWRMWNFLNARLKAVSPS